MSTLERRPTAVASGWYGTEDCDLADVVRQALAEDWDSERLSEALDAQQDRRHSKVG